MQAAELREYKIDLRKFTHCLMYCALVVTFFCYIVYCCFDALNTINNYLHGISKVLYIRPPVRYPVHRTLQAVIRMKSAVLFFLATAIAVSVSLPVSGGEVGKDDPPLTNATEVELPLSSNVTEVEPPLSNVTEPLVEDDNNTELSGDFVVTTSQPVDEFSGSEEPVEEKLSVRSLTEYPPVVAESGSGIEVNVTDTGSAIEELPIDEIEIEEMEGEVDEEEDGDVAEPEGDEQGDTK